VPEPALKFLEYVFLALLYLFFLRVLRAVWLEVKEPRLAVAPGPEVAPPPQGRQAKPHTGGLKLVVVSPQREGQAAYEIDGELTIGRGPGAGVPLTSDNFVSQLHARVFRSGNEYWVEDLGSTNGTLVNGRRLSGAVPLRRGDRVQVGRTVLELRK
jgi:hypothetical protein